MSTEKFKIEKIGGTTRVTQLLDDVIQADMFLNLSVDFFLVGDKLVLRTKTHNDIVIPYDSIDDKLASTDIETYALEIAGANYFNS